MEMVIYMEIAIKVCTTQYTLTIIDYCGATSVMHHSIQHAPTPVGPTALLHGGLDTARIRSYYDLVIGSSMQCDDGRS